jgi:glycosyltransferase involved in cell wall biosynthesis
LKIYVNFLPGSIGGPSVFATRFYDIFLKKNHIVTSSLSENCDAALWSITPPSFEQIVFCRQHHIKSVYRIAGIYIQEFFDIMNEPNPGISYNEEVKNILPHIDQIIFQSNWPKEIVCKTLSISPKNYRIIYNATDTALFRPANPSCRDNEYINIICTGYLRRKFRIQVPFEILKRLRIKSKLFFIGNTDNECRIELMKISDSPFADRVIHIPHVDNRELVKHLQAFDIFLHPVQGDWCPNAVIEALSCGLPVVCGSWGGQSELVGDGGIVVQNTKRWDYGEAFIGGCCQAIEKIALNMDEFKIKARKRAEEVFNMERLYNEYYEVMQNDAPKSSLE